MVTQFSQTFHLCSKVSLRFGIYHGAIKTNKEEPALIEVRHLCKRYGNHMAVADLSFTIEKGKVYGFLGPNGSIIMYKLFW